MRDYKGTVVFDFDGVIHSYKSGWRGADNIPDPPVPGIKEAMEDITKEYKIVICSTRCADAYGLEAMEQWLKFNEIPYDSLTAEKVPAVAYVDDRAICFDGKPERLLKTIKDFKPWNKE